MSMWQSCPFPKNWYQDETLVDVAISRNLEGCRLAIVPNEGCDAESILSRAQVQQLMSQLVWALQEMIEPTNEH